jgi:hypothetical protein
MLRRCDGPPELHVQRDGACVALHPSADSGIRGAAILGDRERLEAALAPRIGGIAESRVVAWRLRRRIVVRLEGEDGAIHWLKLLDPKNFDRAVRAFRRIRSAPPPVRLILPEHELPELEGFLLPHAQGSCLHESLRSGANVATDTLAAALRSLAAVETAPGLPTCGFAEARDAATRMLERAAAIDPSLLDLASRVRSLPAPSGPDRTAFVHGDLHDKQLFFRGETASFIDLEGMSTGDARFDAVNLAEHLRLRELQWTGSSGNADVRMLAACGLEPEDADTRVFRAAVRARLCAVYTLRPRWRELAFRLHAEAFALVNQMQ